MSIAEEFDRLGPWVTRFTIDGHDYGGGYDAAHDAAERIDDFHAQLPAVASILELGSLEGGHTVCLARLPGVQRVVGSRDAPRTSNGPASSQDCSACRT